MTDKSKIQEIAEEYARRSGLFVVDVILQKGNKIIVYIDSMKGVCINECVNLSRHIESFFDREKEDFELEVSSPGLDHPLQHPMQFAKNFGRDVFVVLSNGKKISGILTAYDGESLSLETEKIIKEGKKKRTEKTKETISLKEIKQTKVKVLFK